MKLLKKILDHLPSYLGFQRIFKILNTISLRGMNYGGSSNFKSSGEINVFRQLKKELFKTGLPPVIFDVGANDGSYTTLLREHFPPQSAIMAFEPSKASFEQLKHRHSGDGIQCYNFGFGEKNEVLHLFLAGEGLRHASLYKRQSDQLGFDTARTEEVHIQTIDDFCEKNQINFIFLLKLDIEGNEFKALKGASKMLSEKRIQNIQFEFGGTNIDSRTFFRDFWILLHENYRLYRIVKNGLYPIKEYDESLEIFYYTNYFARLK